MDNLNAALDLARKAAATLEKQRGDDWGKTEPALRMLQDAIYALEAIKAAPRR